LRNQHVKPLAIGCERGGFLKGFPRDARLVIADIAGDKLTRG